MVLTTLPKCGRQVYNQGKYIAWRQRMKGRAKRVPLDRIKFHICAWIGCKEIYEIKGGIDSIHPPAGWRLIFVTKGDIGEVKNIIEADVDGVLCPKHFKELLALLKVGGLIEGIG
jgi:hypothetical protein